MVDLHGGYYLLNHAMNWIPHKGQSPTLPNHHMNMENQKNLQICIMMKPNCIMLALENHGDLGKLAEKNQKITLNDRYE
jgi:hypothetical protein